MAVVEDDLGKRLIAQASPLPVAGGHGGVGFAHADGLGGEDAIRAENVQ